jgi:iron-sulfur cluster repair protein YtfE (RIC family)
MSTAQFLAALNTVEQDHRLVLDNVQALKDAISRLMDPDVEDPDGVLDQLREISAYLATQFEAHMEEEETTLFPLLERQPEGRDLVARLRREHDEIRRRREEFGDCLAVAEGLEGGAPKMVLVDLLIYGWDLWEFLDNHAHLETQAVHKCLARSLKGPAASP